MAKVLMVILAHDHPSSLRDLVANARRWCPAARLLLYNSGENQNLGADLDVERFPRPRQYLYAKITPFFFHLFEWLAAEKVEYDCVVNLETDLLFIRPGFEGFLDSTMRDADYMTPNLIRHVSPTSRWRPYRSLKAELPDWYSLWGFKYVHGGFSPAQVFTRRFIETLLGHAKYPEIVRLVEANRSFTLQEVLFPTLPDFLGLRLKSYPDELRPVNRYRPFQALSSVQRALRIPAAYFVHPIRRTSEDPARRLILDAE